MASFSSVTVLNRFCSYHVPSCGLRYHCDVLYNSQLVYCLLALSR